MTRDESTVTTRTDGCEGFAVWITGLPASGKSTLTAALVKELILRGVRPIVLESDMIRRIVTPEPKYTRAERDFFYKVLLELGILITGQGIPVIFDATAPRRSYRRKARKRIARFLEVYVECTLEVCIARDPKDIYRKAKRGGTKSVPGVQAPYEIPEYPELVVRGDLEPPEIAARRIAKALKERRFFTQN